MDIHERIIGAIESPSWKNILMGLVKAEGMDPWDIDVAIVANGFLEKINAMRKLDFRVPANAVLASAILVRFKSEVWELYPQEELLERLEDEVGWDYRIDGQKVPDLNAQKRVTRRKVTIDDLIHAVEDVMKKEKTRARNRVHIVPPELLNIALEEREDYEEVLEGVYQRVLASRDADNLVLFSQLVPNQNRGEVISTLIPLLHLATQDKLVVWQEEVFKEIFISVNENGHGPKTSD